jgi:hypothetical protein
MGEEGVVLEDGVHRAVERRNLIHTLAADQDLAGIRPLEAGDHAQGGGFPAP